MNTKRIVFYIALLLCFVIGCEQPKKTKPLTYKQAHAKFLNIVEKEYNLKPVVRPFANSLWVYIPMEKEFFSYTPKREGPQQSDELQESLTIKYLNTKFENNSFVVKYDIAKTSQYAKDPGYSSSYHENFTTTQRHIVTALYRTFGHFEKRESDQKFYEPVEGDVTYANPKKNETHKELVHSYVKTEQAPKIFVVVLANIKQGLEITMMVTLEDLKRGSSDQTFTEEYQRRFVTQPLIGNTNILNDKEGQHVNFHDVGWSEFLTQQIAHRIRHKYQQSKFKPSENTIDELTTQIKQSIEAYNFDNFTEIRLHNMADKSDYIIDKEKLANFTPTDSGSQEKYHVIKFF